jgi:hypothetical protein
MAVVEGKAAMKKSKPAPLFKTKNAAEECVRRLLRSATKRDAENAELRAQFAAKDELLNAAQFALEKSRAACETLNAQREQMKQERDAARAQLCAAREALEEIAEGDGCNSCLGPGCDQRCKVIASDVLAASAPPCPHAAALATEERRVLALAIQVAATNSQSVVETLSVEGIIAEHDARIRAEERAKTLEEAHRSICAKAVQAEHVGEPFTWCDAALVVHDMANSENGGAE